MSATEARRVVTVERGSEWEDGFARPRVVLTPYAAPSVLGLYGFAAATFMVALHLTGVYGGAKTDDTLWPFAAMFGGVAQFLAGMWAYRVRDTIATAMHGMWGSFWIAWGILNLLIVLGKLPAVPPGSKSDPAFAMWFWTLGAITVAGALAAFAESPGLFGLVRLRGGPVRRLDRRREDRRLAVRDRGGPRVVHGDRDDAARRRGEGDPSARQAEEGREHPGQQAREAHRARMGRARG
jgi:succinate-acetate transporter protein